MRRKSERLKLGRHQFISPNSFFGTRHFCQIPSKFGRAMHDLNVEYSDDILKSFALMYICFLDLHAMYLRSCDS